MNDKEFKRLLEIDGLSTEQEFLLANEMLNRCIGTLRFSSDADSFDRDWLLDTASKYIAIAIKLRDNELNNNLLSL